MIDKDLDKWLEELKLLIKGKDLPFEPVSHIVIHINDFRDPACAVIFKDQHKQVIDDIVEKEME